MFHGKLKPLKNPSSFRRIAVVNWKAPNDPTVYADIKVNANPILKFIDELNQKSKIKITTTHVIAKALALTFKKYPDINGIVKWNKIYLRKNVDLFLQVAIEKEDGKREDLSGAKINEVEHKTIEEIAQELHDKSKNIRKKKDPQFKNTLKLINFIPNFILGPTIRFLSFLTHNFNVDLPKLGIPGDPFGSAMITSVGGLKLPAGFPPLVPLSRVPFILCVGEIEKKPWVINDEVVACPVLNLKVTFDHRFMDGLLGSKMHRYVLKILENPSEYL